MIAEIRASFVLVQFFFLQKIKVQFISCVIVYYDSLYNYEISDDKTYDDKILINIPTNDSEQRSELICSLSQRNDTQIIALRELLKSSDGACIEQFIDKAKLVEASLNEQKEHLNSHIYLQWNRRWDNIFLHSIRDAVKTMNVPSAETKTYKQISMTPGFKIESNGKELVAPSELFLQRKELWYFYCNVALIDDRVHYTVFNACRKDFVNVIVTGVGVEFIGNDGRFAIVRSRSTDSSKDEAQFIVDLSRKRIRKTTAKVNTALLNLDSREWRIVGFDNSFFQRPFFYVWSEKRKAIANIHDVKFIRANCQPRFLMEDVYSEPKLISHYGDIIVSVDKDERIIVEHRENGSRIEVVQSQHQLSLIDSIDVDVEEKNIVRMNLVDLKDRVVMRCKANLTDDVSLSWEVMDVFKLDIPTTETLTHVFAHKQAIGILVNDTLYNGVSK